MNKNTKYLLITYKNGNTVDFLYFDTIEKSNEIKLPKKDIDKIRLFKLNEDENGRILEKELYINSIKDGLSNLEDSKILGYSLIERQEFIFLKLIYKISSATQEEYGLYFNRRYITTLISKNAPNEKIFWDGASAADI
ncbi:MULTISPECIES: hypothetical protein [Clostridia]|uniref:hypothetical protein n=1 Tax=Clostridia TaxID=186801 RepID=UPI002A8C2919|nr:hypothetical protein [Peptostreptococcus porci]MDY5098761.1 hypothetical protein [Clostridium sp.]MDY5437426.1 hypothetical protein [Peptostreptococcus porci]